MLQDLFFQLIQVALGNRTFLSSTPSAEEWEQLYQMSIEQALTGITFSGIEQLPKEQRPPLSITWTWNEDAINIERDNQQHEKRAAQLLRHLNKDGFNALILKGITNNQNYTNYLHNRRSTGDIDVWLWSDNDKSNINRNIRTIVNYCKSITSVHHICYIHVDFPVFSDIPVEAHFRPSFLCNPYYNNRLQRWFIEQKIALSSILKSTRQEDLSNDSNYYRFIVIYQLLHLYKHLFEEGIGLRQILDFYLLNKSKGFQILKDQEFIFLINRFGLKEFLTTLLWVISSVFDQAIPNIGQIDPSNNKRQGEFLLSEIMQAGNFGQYDKRIKHGGNAILHAWEKLKHNFRLLTHYPSEVLFEPFFRLYHFFWRQYYK